MNVAVSPRTTLSGPSMSPVGGSFGCGVDSPDSASDGSSSGAATSTYSVSLRSTPWSSVTVSVTSYLPTVDAVNVVETAVGSLGSISRPSGVRIDHSWATSSPSGSSEPPPSSHTTVPRSTC
nr:hypothetical protein [Halobaculum roseum]